MKPHAIAPFVALFILSSEPAAAVRIIGHGLSSCGAWTEARRARGADSLAFMSWALGYLSGINEGTNAFAKRDILVRSDAQALLGWLDNYCLSNPLEPLKKAADELVGELLKRDEKK